MTNVVQTFLNWIKSIFALILSFLPNSPFQFSANAEFAQFAGYLNYFIPIGSFIIILTAWLSAIAFYYAYSAILRFIKAIE